MLLIWIEIEWILYLYLYLYLSSVVLVLVGCGGRILESSIEHFLSSWINESFSLSCSAFWFRFSNTRKFGWRSQSKMVTGVCQTEIRRDDEDSDSLDLNVNKSDQSLLVFIQDSIRLLPHVRNLCSIRTICRFETWQKRRSILEASLILEAYFRVWSSPHILYCSLYYYQIDPLGLWEHRAASYETVSYLLDRIRFCSSWLLHYILLRTDWLVLLPQSLARSSYCLS